MTLQYSEPVEKVIAEINKAEDSVLDLIDKTLKLNADKRWSAIAKTDIEKGFMSLVRAVRMSE